MRLKRSFLLLALLCGAISSISSAQTPAPLQRGDRLLGEWAGASFYSPVGKNWGKTSDRNLYIAGLRSEWVLESKGSFALAATADLIPLAVVSHNPTWRESDEVVTTKSGKVITQTGTSPVLGAGLMPFGMKLWMPSVGRGRVYINGAVGAIWFTRDMPVPDSRKGNVAFEYGGGVQFEQATQSIVLGYKFHHLSNAYTAPRNPGLDGNVIYLGLLKRR